MAYLSLIISPDGKELRQLIRTFEGAGLAVDTTTQSAEGLRLTLESAPTLILLAEDVPPIGGQELLAILRRLSRAPIIIIGSGGDSEAIHALETGADAYLRRPFSQAVILARATALLRRYRANSVAAAGPIQRDRSALALSRTEERLLACLLARDGRAVSSQALLLEGWGGSASYDTLRFYLRRLRKKLATSPGDLKLISIRGMGHRVVSGTTNFPMPCHRRQDDGPGIRSSACEAKF